MVRLLFYERALETVDVALYSASKVTFMTSTEVDEKFEEAIRVLSRYEQEFFLRRGPSSKDHSSRPIHELMAAAKEKDRLSSILINSLKDKLQVREKASFFRDRILMLSADPQRAEREPIKVVEFLIHKSLPDRNPIIVPRKRTLLSTLSNNLTPRSEVLHKNSNLTEILWNFSRFKDKTRRITLSQNPHFYAWLPTSPEEYGDEFKAEPIETFQQHARVHVLTDIQGPLGRVFVETGQNTRIFDNVWIPNNAIIFKGETECSLLSGFLHC